MPRLLVTTAPLPKFQGQESCLMGNVSSGRGVNSQTHPRSLEGSKKKNTLAQSSRLDASRRVSQLPAPSSDIFPTPLFTPTTSSHLHPQPKMAPTLDPNVNTREEYTMAAVAQPIPDDADPKWKELSQTLKDLTLKLLNHDAMRRNKTQPFMTPAADKNRVYFLWDSVSRTLARLPFVLSSFFSFSSSPSPVLHISIPRYPAQPENEHQADPVQMVLEPQATLYTLPPQLEASSAWSPAFAKTWNMECLAKSQFLSSLILGQSGAAADPMTMMMNMMMAGSGDSPEWGDDIKQLAQKLRDI